MSRDELSSLQPVNAEAGVSYQFDGVAPALGLRLDAMFPDVEIGAFDHVLIWGATPNPGSDAARWAVSVWQESGRPPGVSAPGPELVPDPPESLFRIYVHIEPLDGSARWCALWIELEAMVDDWNEWWPKVVTPPNAAELLEKRKRVLRDREAKSRIRSDREQRDAEICARALQLAAQSDELRAEPRQRLPAAILAHWDRRWEVAGYGDGLSERTVEDILGAGGVFEALRLRDD